ncbi:short-chain dehydrogenase [Mucilaginibacter hurinus]|uniref:Short-chain dehydrogenase n=1 Tax=Mucilaginibacter hurinus TaxID=2201324 RepID=A0A367GMI7_9SPHI|nr:SDR family oxidoreductase [Mucilaginibacter hurinus]RCH54669.1 short-chain dehydrogenase [Mucilaginibacter hurinus]
MKLKDKISLITGAADGIGLACAKLFCAEGSFVIMADIDYEKCAKEAKGLNALAVHCDVRSTEDVKQLIEQVITKYKKIDVLINNVAVAIGGNITEMNEDDWNMVLNTNLTSAYRFIKHVLPHMLAQKTGSIINMSSTQAHRSWYNWTAYAAAKGALLSMTTQLAGQFGAQNIRVNSISPGTIATPMLQKRIEEEGAELLDKSVMMHAMERLGKPEEVAAVALLLAGDDAAFVNGIDIKIDGGLSTLPRYNEIH